MINIYGDNNYGSVVYGGYEGIVPSIAPFFAAPIGYNTIHLTWVSPIMGEATILRLVKNSSGYPVSEDDGVILFEDTAAINAYTDTGLLDNTFYYYSMWLYVDGGWTKVGETSSLSVGYLGMVDVLTGSIPAYLIKGGSSVGDGIVNVSARNEDEYYNPHLFLFLSIFGWGFDLLRAHIDKVVESNNPNQIHYDYVRLLAANFGIEPEVQASASLVRRRVSDAGNLAAHRGTLKGLEALGEASAGWGLQLSISDNLFANGDQSIFEHPNYPDWSSVTAYPIGEKVTGSDGVVYVSIAETYNQAPPDHPGAWSALVSTLDYTLNPVDGASYVPNIVTTWGIRDADDSSVSGELLNLTISVPVGPDDTTNINALQVAGGGSGFTGYIIQNNGANGISAVETSIPLPSPFIWVEDYEFQENDYAVFASIVYRALSPNIGLRPDLSSETWVQVGADDRVPIQVSFEAHAGYGVGSSFSTAATTLGLVFYDDYGNEVGEVTSTDVTNLGNKNTYIETFGEKTGLRWDSGYPDPLGNPYTFIDPSGEAHWYSTIDSEGNTVATVHGKHRASVSYHTKVQFTGDAQCIGVTFRSGDDASDQRLIIRYDGLSHQTYVNRTQLVDINGSSVSTVSLTSAIEDGQRVIAEYFSRTGTINIYVDGDNYGTISSVSYAALAQMTAGMEVASW